MLALGVPTYAQQPWKHFTTHVAVVRVDVLAGTAPVHRWQVPQQCAGTREHHRTAPAAETSLWKVLLVMVVLWNRAGHYIFALWFLLSFFFFSSPNLSGRRLSQRLQSGCLPYFYTRCDPSANLGCRSQMCCTRLAGNT